MVTLSAQDVVASGRGAISRSGGGAGALPDQLTPGATSTQRSRDVVASIIPLGHTSAPVHPLPALDVYVDEGSVR
eukprot:12890776-Prorocentrum_lima.AAC.1